MEGRGGEEMMEGREAGEGKGKQGRRRWREGEAWKVWGVGSTWRLDLSHASGLEGVSVSCLLAAAGQKSRIRVWGKSMQDDRAPSSSTTRSSHRDSSTRSALVVSSCKNGREGITFEADCRE